jgi:hypothetical protein
MKIYIPSTTNQSTPISNEVRQLYIDDALNTFSGMFGGATAIDENGAWVDDNGELIKEDVTIVYSFVQNLNDKTIDNVVNYAGKIKKELSQSSVSIEINEKCIS